MNRDEQIRRYLDGELAGVELISFEAEVNNSPELKNLVDSYRNTLNQFKKIENVNVEESYFVNIIPRFRERNERRKQFRFKPVFTYGSISLVIVSVLLIFLFKRFLALFNYPVAEFSFPGNRCLSQKFLKSALFIKAIIRI